MRIHTQEYFPWTLLVKSVVTITHMTNITLNQWAGDMKHSCFQLSHKGQWMLISWEELYASKLCCDRQGLQPLWLLSTHCYTHSIFNYWNTALICGLTALLVICECHISDLFGLLEWPSPLSLTMQVHSSLFTNIQFVMIALEMSNPCHKCEVWSENKHQFTCSTPQKIIAIS